MSWHLGYSGRAHVPAVEGAPAVSLRDLCITYPGFARPALVLDHLHLPAGQQLMLVGANGSGKSTLLKALAGLITPQQGSIQIHGRAAGACHHRVAYLAQLSELDWSFPIDVRRLALSGRFVHLGWLRRPTAADEQIVQHALDRLGIAHLARRQIGELSGGQQQRTLLARALVQQAQLLLFDEPLNAVDIDTRRIFQQTLAQLRTEGRSVIVATHDHGRLDEQVDQVLCLHDGRRLATPGPGARTPEPRACCGTIGQERVHDASA